MRVGLLVMSMLVAATVPSAILTAQEPTDERITRAKGEIVEWVGTGNAGLWAGDSLELVIEARIKDGWHIYGLEEPFGAPTRITVSDESPFPASGPVREPAPEKIHREVLDREFLEHSGTVRFTVPLQIPKDAKAGAYQVPIRIRYAPCDPTVCLLADPKLLRIPVTVIERPKRDESRKRTLRGRRLKLTSWGQEIVAGSSLLDVEIEADIDFGWHIYSLHDTSGLGVPSRITLVPQDGVQSPFALRDGVRESKPKVAKGTFGETILKHEVRATFRVPLRMAAGTRPGEYQLQIRFDSGACDANGCDPPEKLLLKLPVTVKPAAASSGQDSSRK